MTRYRDLRIKQ